MTNENMIMLWTYSLEIKCMLPQNPILDPSRLLTDGEEWEKRFHRMFGPDIKE